MTSQITVSQDHFTEMVAIRVNDDLTTQALVLTPAEAVRLRDVLNSQAIDGQDVDHEREARHLKHLTIYNCHNLPTINRPGFEATVNLLVHFDFEIHQRVKVNGSIETSKVGSL